MLQFSRGIDISQVDSFDLLTYPLTFSDTLNKFLVVGCDDLAIINGTSGCVSICRKKKDVPWGICSGIDCYETSVPNGLKAFTTSLQSLSNYEKVASFSSCRYAFLAKVKSFIFQGTDDLADPWFYNRIVDKVLIVLEWYVGEKTNCRQAQQNFSSYACQRYTNCTDIDLGFGGYRCSCCLGFEGNPYLSSGCTDIDECVGPSNPCSNQCTNTPGGYECSCLKGHHGDGLKSGSGCAFNSSQSALKFTLVIGGGIGCMAVIGCYWVFQIAKKISKRRARANNFSRNGGLLFDQLTSSDDTMERTKMFTARELEKAIDHFNESRILDQGGQGTVYKGMLSDGRIMAIKKSKKVNEDQTLQFINEVAILSEINPKSI